MNTARKRYERVLEETSLYHQLLKTNKVTATDEGECNLLGDVVQLLRVKGHAIVIHDEIIDGQRVSTTALHYLTCHLCEDTLARVGPPWGTL